MEDRAFYLLFVIAILIHNTEEALWLPAWSKFDTRFTKHVEASEFRFAVLIVTILALLCTTFFILFPHIKAFNYIYFGFLGAMIANVFVPHLAATIVMKKYAPGLISGLLLNLPINGLIVYKAINLAIIDVTSFIASTAVVGIILIVSLPLFFQLGSLVKDYQTENN